MSIWDRIPSAEQSSLVEKQDALKIEAVSRTLGHTDWMTSDYILAQMKTRAYTDGSAVFSFRNKDMLLFEPPGFTGETDEWVQPVEYLYDKTDFRYLTVEERVDAGIIEAPADD